VKAQYSGGGWLLVPHLEYALQYELKKAGVPPPAGATK
jgi:hypothetical protein